MTKHKLTALSLVLIALLAACNKGTDTNTTADTVATTASENLAQTRIFVDSAGRSVEIPLEITKIAPTGVPSQMILFTAAPDKLVGLARQFTSENTTFLEPQYANYAVFGQFYGKNASLNMEALIKANPDVIIDMGQTKKTIKEDMDALQEQLGIPVVFIEASITSYGETYKKLGELLGMEAKMKMLSDYASEKIENAQKTSSAMDDSAKVTVYMAGGDNGLLTNGIGSFHAQSLDLVGAKNIADLQASSIGSGNEISFEQLLLWNPEVILVDTQVLYDMITSDSTWQSLDAVKNGKVYKIPTAPFNFINDPPSVNRILGISWLGNLLYPDSYEFSDDVVEEFSKTFYHTQLSAEDIEEVLKNAR